MLMSKTSQELRHERILQYITEHGHARVDELAELEDVSEMTIHRDLTTLAQARLLQRVRGGARVMGTLSELHAAQRRAFNKSIKTMLCEAVFPLIPAGATVAIDDSTTLEPLISLLRGHVSTLIGHSATVVAELRQEPSTQFVCCGGEYFPETESFLGAATVRQLAELSADIAIVSTTSVRGQAIYHPDSPAAATKRALLNTATTRILVTDITKIDAPGLFKVADLSAFQHIITDEPFPVPAGTTLHVIPERNHHG